MTNNDQLGNEKAARPNSLRFEVGTEETARIKQRRLHPAACGAIRRMRRAA